MRARRVLILLTGHLIVDETGRHSPVAANSNSDLQGWHGQLSDMAVCISIKWPPRSRIHSFSTFYSSCILATRVCPRLDPLRLHTGLGLARTPAILYDRGCRLHILRCLLRTQVCDDACISSCDPVQVFTFPDGINSASGRLQMSLHSVGIRRPGMAPVPINYLTILQ